MNDDQRLVDRCLKVLTHIAEHTVDGWAKAYINQRKADLFPYRCVRTCHICGRTQEHVDSVLPYAECLWCGSADTRISESAEHEN